MARMRLVTTLETESGTWEQTDQGRWVRWNDAAQAWEEQPSGPWVEPDPEDLADPVRSPEPEPAPASTQPDGPAPLVGGGGGIPESWNPLDAWWNRTFPPYSRRRLLFGLVALPFITAIVAVVDHFRGRSAPFAVYLFSTVAGGIILAVVFWAHSFEVEHRRVREPPDGPGGSPTTADALPHWDANPGPPNAGPPAAPARAPEGPIVERVVSLPSWVRESLLCLPISFVAVVIWLALVSASAAFSRPGLIAAAAAAALFTAVFVARRTVLSVVIVSLVVGFGVAGLLQAISLMMFVEADSFALTWAVCSVVAFVFAFPLWYSLKRSAERRDAGSMAIPAWVFVAAVAVLMMGGALAYRLS
jgi:hypothetical protein